MRKPFNSIGYQFDRYIQKVIFFTLVLLFFANFIYAQKDTNQANILDTVPRESNYTPSSFPGGSSAWTKYLMRNLIVPEEARNIKFDGSIVVTFTVDEAGKLKDFKASDGPDALRSEAIRIVKKSGRWLPAYSNGKPVSSSCKQAITFKLNL